MRDLLILTLIQNIFFFFIATLSPLRTWVIMTFCIFLYFVGHTKFCLFATTPISCCAIHSHIFVREVIRRVLLALMPSIYPVSFVFIILIMCGLMAISHCNTSFCMRVKQKSSVVSTLMGEELGVAGAIRMNV